MINRSFLFFILLFNMFCLFAQDTSEDVSVNRQFWGDYNTKIQLEKENRFISGFIGYRTISPHIYDKYLFVPTYNFLNTKSSDFLNLKKPLINSFHLGMGIYYTNNLNDTPDDFEFRLMQGFKFFTPEIASIYFKNYIRLEERFQNILDGSSWTTSFRFRYRISTVIEWKKHLFNFNEGLYLPMSIEFFYNLKKADRFNDVIRISPGIGYKLNDDWKFEVHLSYHNTKNTTENESSSNDFVVRLRIYKLLAKKVKIIESKEENIKELIE